VAARLGTSIGHIRFALGHVPRPTRQWGKAAAPVVQQWRQQAGQILTREFFEREYLQGGKTLRELQAQAGFPRKFLAERAGEHHIPVDGTARIDPAWLRKQYLTHRRFYTGIAAELGVTDMTVITAARRHHIPSRPQGVHSRPEMLTTLPGNVPRDIRRAVEGGLKGWHRLRRFQAAMTCPTIEAAATSLRTHQSALIHQFRRLERDIGAALYQPAAPGQPMRPPRRGAVLLKTLARPDVQALAAAHAPEVAGPAHGSGRYRERMPISRGPGAVPAQQVIGFAGVIALLGIDFHGHAQELLGAGAVLLGASGYAAAALVYRRWLADTPALGVTAVMTGLSSAAFLAPAAAVLPSCAAHDKGEGEVPAQLRASSHDWGRHARLARAASGLSRVVLCASAETAACQATTAIVATARGM
jgi:hypothetical protein